MRIMNPKRKLHLPGASTLHVVNVERIPDLPSLPGLNSSLKLGPKLPPDSATLRSIFTTSAPCAIVTSIFNQIDVTINESAPIPSQRNFAANVNTINDNILYAGIVDSVQHPPCIVAAASAYVKEVLQEKDFVGVHWRYNEDWKKLCKFPWFQSLCDRLDVIKPEHVARGIANKLKTVVNLTRNIPVYVAAPPSINDFRNEIYNKLQKQSKFLLKPPKTLREFLSDKYKLCWEETGWKIIEEIESLCEMEIMMRSSLFFSSVVSSWSKNIYCWRSISEKTSKHKANADLLSLAFDAAHKVHD